MYPAYFDSRIHEINRINLAGLLLIVALFIDLAGVLKNHSASKRACLGGSSVGQQ